MDIEAETEEEIEVETRPELEEAEALAETKETTKIQGQVGGPEAPDTPITPLIMPVGSIGSSGRGRGTVQTVIIALGEISRTQSRHTTEILSPK